MEDQQLAAGDLTSGAVEPESGAEEVGTDETGSTEEAGTVETGGTEEAGIVEAGITEEAGAGGGARVRRPAGKWTAVAVAVAAALFVGSAAFAGATLHPYLTERAAAATKLNVARSAANAITTLWTYTPENMDTLADRASAYLSGDFEAQYRKFVDALAAPNRQAKITNSTQVTGAAVESLDDPNAVVIVYTNTTSTSPLTKNIPALKYLSYRLFMKRLNARWMVTRMATITSLDLTPHS